MNGNFCPGIEPADIIGGRPHDLNFCIGMAKGAGPLSGMAGDAHMGLVLTGVP